jgi:hypothetical protein
VKSLTKEAPVAMYMLLIQYDPSIPDDGSPSTHN